MTLGQNLLTELGLNLKLSEHFIKADDGPFKGSTAPIFDLGTYEFKYLNTGRFHLNNFLQIIMFKKYMSRNMPVPPLNNCM